MRTGGTDVTVPLPTPAVKPEQPPCTTDPDNSRATGPQSPSEGAGKNVCNPRGCSELLRAASRPKTTSPEEAPDMSQGRTKSIEAMSSPTQSARCCGCCCCGTEPGRVRQLREIEKRIKIRVTLASSVGHAQRQGRPRRKPHTIKYPHCVRLSVRSLRQVAPATSEA